MGVGDIEGLVEDLISAVLVMLQQGQHALAELVLDPKKSDGFCRAEERYLDLISLALSLSEDKWIAAMSY